MEKKTQKLKIFIPTLTHISTMLNNTLFNNEMLFE